MLFSSPHTVCLCQTYEFIRDWTCHTMSSWMPQLKSGFLFALSLCLMQQKKSGGQNLCQRVLWNKTSRIWSMIVQKWHNNILAEQDQNLPGSNVACPAAACVTYFEVFLQPTYVRNSAAALIAISRSLQFHFSFGLQGFKCQFCLIFLYLCDYENSTCWIPYVLSWKCLAYYRGTELPWQEGKNKPGFFLVISPPWDGIKTEDAPPGDWFLTQRTVWASPLNCLWSNE